MQFAQGFLHPFLLFQVVVQVEANDHHQKQYGTESDKQNTFILVLQLGGLVVQVIHIVLHLQFVHLLFKLGRCDGVLLLHVEFVILEGIFVVAYGFVYLRAVLNQAGDVGGTHDTGIFDETVVGGKGTEVVFLVHGVEV